MWPVYSHSIFVDESGDRLSGEVAGRNPGDGPGFLAPIFLDEVTATRMALSGRASNGGYFACPRKGSVVERWFPALYPATNYTHS